MAEEILDFGVEWIVFVVKLVFVFVANFVLVFVIFSKKKLQMGGA